MTASREARVAFVDVPSGLAGFLLVVRMTDSRSKSERLAGGGWTVRVPVPDAAAVRTLLDGVQSWLHQEQILETRVRVGNDVYRVGVDHADLQIHTQGGK